MGILAIKTLMSIQNELKAPKNQYNSFGKYKYRNCEDILEALKPICNKFNSAIVLSDELVTIGDRYYVKATATEDSLAVHYIDQTANHEFYSYNIAKEKGFKYLPVELILYPAFHFAYGYGSLVGICNLPKFLKAEKNKKKGGEKA